MLLFLVIAERSLIHKFSLALRAFELAPRHDIGYELGREFAAGHLRAVSADQIMGRHEKFERDGRIDIFCVRAHTILFSMFSKDAARSVAAHFSYGHLVSRNMDFEPVSIEVHHRICSASRPVKVESS